jgi:hypothetical protein
MIDLGQYAADLAEQRDRYIKEAGQRASAASGLDVGICMGQAAGLMLALSFLHTATDGEHGERYEDQPNPFGQDVSP